MKLSDLSFPLTRPLDFSSSATRRLNKVNNNNNNNKMNLRCTVCGLNAEGHATEEP